MGLWLASADSSFQLRDQVAKMAFSVVPHALKLLLICNLSLKIRYGLRLVALMPFQSCGGFQVSLRRGPQD